MKAPHPSEQSQRGLDWLNFFIADVETAFGPFVAVYLTTAGWSQGAIGTVITVNSSIALASQIPAGWLVDNIRRKRVILAVCIACIAAGSLLIALFPQYWVVTAGEALHGITGGAVRTAIAAVGIGLVGHRAYHTRVGRNHRFDSFGNAATAAGMGALGTYFSPQAPFFAAAALCIPATIALYMVRGDEIDYARSRQASDDEGKEAGDWRVLFENKRLMLFAGCLFLFQFANASILPLAGEHLAANFRAESEIVTSGMVVIPQIVTALIATWVARKADEWGRKWLLAAAFAALLARAALFAFVVDPWVLLGVQVLGGPTAAVIGILTPLVVADCTKGSGRYNVALGTVGMISGIGATVSTTAIGYLAQVWGFAAGFGALALVAATGLGLLVLLPETADEARSVPA